MRLLVGVVALGIATLPVSACGSGAASGAASSAAHNASQAASTAAAQVKSVTAPTKTQTVTKSVAGPGASVSVHNSTSVKVQAAHGTPTTTDSSGGGVPWWGWVLIGMAVVGVLVAIFSAGRRRGKAASGVSAPSTPGPAPPSTPGPSPPSGSDPPVPPTSP